jgi:hypothetical protein
VNTIRKVHANFNTSIRIIGILRVMFDSRITLAQQVSAQLEEHFKDKVFKSIIPRNIRLAEAPSHGMPGVNFDPSSRGAMGYVEFANELIERMPQFRVNPAATGAATAGASGARPAAPGNASAVTTPVQAASAGQQATPAARTGSTAPADVTASVPGAGSDSARSTASSATSTAQAVAGDGMSAPTYAPTRMGAGYTATEHSQSGPAAQTAPRPWSPQPGPVAGEEMTSVRRMSADGSVHPSTPSSQGEPQR